MSAQHHTHGRDYVRPRPLVVADSSDLIPSKATSIQTDSLSATLMSAIVPTVSAMNLLSL